jgi:hypothetical protein
MNTLYWNKEDLKIYNTYERYINIRYISYWINLNKSDKQLLLAYYYMIMLTSNKLVNVYKNGELFCTEKLSMVQSFENDNSIITWCPINFKTKEEIADFLDNSIANEMINN